MLRIVNNDLVQDPHGMVCDAVYGTGPSPDIVRGIHEDVEAIYRKADTVAEKQAQMGDVLRAAGVQLIPVILLPENNNKLQPM